MIHWQNPPKVLHADESGPDWKQNWNYHAVVGCLNYIQAITHPNLSYAVHQCTRFLQHPKTESLKALVPKVYSSNPTL